MKRVLDCYWKYEDMMDCVWKCCLSFFLFFLSFLLYATFNNISSISRRSVLLVEEYPEKTNDLSKVTDKLYHMSWIRTHSFRIVAFQKVTNDHTYNAIAHK